MFLIVDSQSSVHNFGFFNDLSLVVVILIQRFLLGTLKLKSFYVVSLQNFAVYTNDPLYNVFKLEAKCFAHAPCCFTPHRNKCCLFSWVPLTHRLKVLNWTLVLSILPHALARLPRC